MAFQKVDDTFGFTLFNELQYVLKSLDLNVDYVKGHGYGNGSNMKGKHQRVQNWFLEITQEHYIYLSEVESLVNALESFDFLLGNRRHDKKKYFVNDEG
ncbi:hypothetical protein CR513_24659, partial [Mucuna pruriens]